MWRRSQGNDVRYWHKADGWGGADQCLSGERSALLDCPSRRFGGGRCRLPRYLTGPACRIGRSARPARRAERLDRISDGGAYQRLTLDGAHPQLLLAVDDRARFEQDCGHVGVSEHDQLVVAIDARLRVDQQPLAMCP